MGCELEIQVGYRKKKNKVQHSRKQKHTYWEQHVVQCIKPLLTNPAFHTEWSTGWSPDCSTSDSAANPSEKIGEDGSVPCHPRGRSEEFLSQLPLSQPPGE